MTRTALAIALLFALIVGACSDDASAPPTPTVPAATATAQPAFLASIDLPGGGSLRLEAAPQRIVSLSPHATEIFCAIGAGDQLLAVDSYANCPEDSHDKPELDSFQPNLEAIAGYEPDLVFTSYDPSGLVESLQRLDIPVLFLDLPTTIDGVYQQIELLGIITGHDDEAGQLLATMRSSIGDIEAALGDVDQGPRFFHELDSTYYTVAPQSFIGDLYATLKAQNIAEGAGQDYPQLSAEVILDRNPEVIVLADEEAGVDASVVKARPGWDVIDAVKNDRICTVQPDIVSRPGPHIVEGLRELAECLYPEDF